MQDKRLLTICAVLLMCILVVAVLRTFPPKHEKFSDKVDEAVEEVQDEIDDHTTSR